MRRITASLAIASAGALAAIALPATANAASGSVWDHGGPVSGYSAQAKVKEPKPIGHKHKISLVTRGTRVSGYWYYASYKGHKEIWLRTNVARTSGHYYPAVCFRGAKISTQCFWAVKPSKPFVRAGWVGRDAHLQIEAATGQSKRKGYFSIYYHSGWYNVG